MVENDMIDALETLSDEIQKLKKEFDEIKLILQDVTNKLEDDED